MVQKQLIWRGIKDRRVLEAMRKVPRHLFVGEELWDRAYDDGPLPIGEEQTISQPYMVALMTEALALKGYETVLEIGTGSGYQAAILAELALQVFSLERIDTLAERARKLLADLGYKNIVIEVRDGTLGLPDQAPFHGIMVTAGAPFIPQTLIEQLTLGGCLVIPVGGRDLQWLKKIIRTERGNLEEDLGGCRFVQLIGEYGWKEG